MGDLKCSNISGTYCKLSIALHWLSPLAQWYQSLWKTQLKPSYQSAMFANLRAFSYCSVRVSLDDRNPRYVREWNGRRVTRKPIQLTHRWTGASSIFLVDALKRESGRPADSLSYYVLTTFVYILSVNWNKLVSRQASHILFHFICNYLKEIYPYLLS